jgi:peptidyl-prolyl cis-trans isomerase SurA
MAAGALFAFARPVSAELANGIEAVVDDSVITYHEVSVLNEQTYAALARKYQSEPSTLEKKLHEMETDNLNSLVERQLVLHDFKTAGYSLPDTVLNDMVQERIRQDFGDRATLTKTLEARGITFDKFRQQVRERFIVEALRSKNISSEIIISPHKVEQFYLAHRDEFSVEDRVRLRVIVLKNSTDTNSPPADRLAGEIYIKLKDGASFAEMATIYSQGSQRNQGGDWGWYEKSQLLKGLSDVAYSVGVGKISHVFCRTAGDDYWVYEYDQGKPINGRHYGTDAATKKEKVVEEREFKDPGELASLPTPTEFYLLRVEDSQTAHFKPLSEVRGVIETSLVNDEQARLMKQWIDKLRKKTFVRTF